MFKKNFIYNNTCVRQINLFYIENIFVVFEDIF